MNSAITNQLARKVYKGAVTTPVWPHPVAILWVERI